MASSPAPLLCVCLRPAWRTDAPLRLDAAAQAPRADETLAGVGAADLAALQLALTLRSRLAHGTRVLALSVGAPVVDDLLREALAAGADEALRVWGRRWPETPVLPDASGATTRAFAGAAAMALRERGPTLVLTGERSGDTAHEMFGGFLAAALGAAFAHRVTAVAPASPEGVRWQVTARLERGYGQAMELAAPAVLTVSASLPRPAYAPLPAWLASRRASVPSMHPELAALPGGTTALRVPVPRVKRFAVPGPGLDAEARIQAMVSLPAGGGGTVLADAPPEQQAEAVLRLLRERGYL